MGPVNFLNAWRCYVLNPYCYNKAACKKLYEKTLDLISEVCFRPFGGMLIRGIHFGHYRSKSTGTTVYQDLYEIVLDVVDTVVDNTVKEGLHLVCNPALSACVFGCLM
jgi:hypothetical protein